MGRKERDCDPDDPHRGDCGDPVALARRPGWGSAWGVGKRTAEATPALVKDSRRRTEGRVLRLMTSDEYPAYPDAPGRPTG